VHQLEIKVLNIIDARCNHEVCYDIYRKGTVPFISSFSSIILKYFVALGSLRWANHSCKEALPSVVCVSVIAKPP